MYIINYEDKHGTRVHCKTYLLRFENPCLLRGKIRMYKNQLLIIYTILTLLIYRCNKLYIVLLVVGLRQKPE